MTYPHPLDDPAFDKLYRKPVWYLAHPLAPDDKHTFQENLDHTLKMIKMCFEEGFHVIAPWHTLVMAWGGDVEPPEQRVKAMETDLRVAYQLGRIILTGHKRSRGMLAEHDAVVRRISEWNRLHKHNLARQVNDGDVLIDLTEMDEALAREHLQYRIKRLNTGVHLG